MLDLDDLIATTTSPWQAGDEPLPGYHLVEPLGRGGFGEVWKCLVPGDFYKAVKLVTSNLDEIPGEDAVQIELEALRRIRAIRHPFLLTTERVERVGGVLVVVMELADRNLLDLAKEVHQQGQPGVPRERLLALMLEAAEAIDFLNVRHGLQHLDVKPANLFLVSDHLKVGDFGLVRGADPEGFDPRGKNLIGLTPRYVSPERLHGTVSRHSDQYSLAVVYQELLTGEPPFAGKSAVQVALEHLKGRPNLAPLPESDRPVVARALAKEPEERFPSCLAFVRSLLAGRDPSDVPPAHPTPTRQIRNLKHALPPTCPGEAHPTRSLARHDTPGPSRCLRRTYRLFPEALLAGTTPPDHGMVQVHGCGPLGEVYLVRSREGQLRLARCLPGQVTDVFHFQDHVTSRLGPVLHPALPPTDVFVSGDGRVIVVSDFEPRTLRDRFRESVARGNSGIPRQELLTLLRRVAEALDALAEKTGLHHRALHPSRVQLHGDGVWVLDFGLVDLFEMTTGQALAPPNARYAAPERFTPEARATADPYSLALIYVEMLTGQLANRDLNQAPAADRPALEKALHADPSQRWSSCTALIQALEGASAPVPSPSPALPPVVADALSRLDTKPREGLPTLKEFVRDALLVGAGPTTIYEGLQFVHRVGRSIEYRGVVRGSDDLLYRHLLAFRDEWNATSSVEDDGTFAFQVPAPGRSWRRLWKRQPGLDVRVRVVANGTDEEPAEAIVVLTPTEANDTQGPTRLREMGPVLLESLIAHLPGNTERRVAPRWPFPYPVQVAPAGHGSPAVVEGEGINLSFTGVGFTLAQPPVSDQLYLRFATLTGLESVAVLIRVVRSRFRPDGRVEVGAVWAALP